MTSLDQRGSQYGAEASLVWVDLTHANADEMDEVGRILGLPHRATRMALAPWQRPRLTDYSTSFFVSATMPLLQAGYHIQAAKLDIFVGVGFLVTAHPEPLPFREQLQARMSNSSEIVRLGTPFLLSMVLDALVSYYEELNRLVQAEIERLEERALHESSETFLEDLVQFKRYTFALSQYADQHLDVFRAFLRPDFLWVAGQEEVEESFADVDDRLTRLTDRLWAARDAVNGAFEIYVSHQSHRTNQVIRVLTSVSIVLFTASIIVSIFGTTVLATVHSGMLTTPIGLLLMIAVIVVTNIAILWLFRYRNWL